jgi:hypothetical protein
MTLEEETLEKIKLVLLCGNDAQAIRLLEIYGCYKNEELLESLKKEVEILNIDKK